MAKPEPSEWGKLNAGQHYLALALDVLRALVRAGLNDYEWILMEEVMEQSWYTSARRKRHEDDWPDPVPCRLNMTEFARDQVIPEEEGDDAHEKLRKRLYEAKTNLVKSHMLVEDEDGLWIQKDVDKWTLADGKTPRLSQGMRSYAIEARNRKMPGKTDNDARNSGHDVSGNPGMDARKNGHAYPKKRARKPAPPVPPIEERTRVLDPQKTEEDTPPTPSPAVGPVGGSLAPLGEERPARPAEADPPARRTPPRPPEFDALLDRIYRLLPGGLSGQLGAMWDAESPLPGLWAEIPAEVWRTAVDEMAKPGYRDKANPPYFLGIVRRLNRERRNGSPRRPSGPPTPPVVVAPPPSPSRPILRNQKAGLWEQLNGRQGGKP